MRLLTNADFKNPYESFDAVLLYPVDPSLPMHALRIDDGVFLSNADWWRVQIAKHLISCGVLFRLVGYWSDEHDAAPTVFGFDPAHTFGGMVPPQDVSSFQRSFEYDAGLDRFIES